MKTIYVTITDELLQELIDEYESSCPLTNEHDFSIYLALEELKRLRRQEEG